METLFGDRIEVPPDIGDNSQKIEDVEMKNDNEDASESATDGRSDLHGPIKSGKNQSNEKRNSFETKSLRKQRHLNNVEKQKIAKAKYEANLALNANANAIGKDSVLIAEDILSIATESELKEDDDRNEEAKRSKTNSSGILISEELLAAINKRDSIKSIVVDKGITDSEMANAMEDPNLMMNDKFSPVAHYSNQDVNIGDVLKDYMLRNPPTDANSSLKVGELSTNGQIESNHVQGSSINGNQLMKGEKSDNEQTGGSCYENRFSREFRGTDF
ncbi:hypothetical protein LXL04_026613 [Taraxacum kok-saghyz]